MSDNRDNPDIADICVFPAAFPEGRTSVHLEKLTQWVLRHDSHSYADSHLTKRIYPPNHPMHPHNLRSHASHTHGNGGKHSNSSRKTSRRHSRSQSPALQVLGAQAFESVAGGKPGQVAAISSHASQPAGHKGGFLHKGAGLLSSTAPKHIPSGGKKALGIEINNNAPVFQGRIQEYAEHPHNTSSSRHGSRGGSRGGSRPPSRPLSRAGGRGEGSENEFQEDLGSWVGEESDCGGEMGEGSESVIHVPKALPHDDDLGIALPRSRPTARPPSLNNPKNPLITLFDTSGQFDSPEM